jgi:hypothetical protein
MYFYQAGNKYLPENCSECGHIFESKEVIWSRFIKNHTGNKVICHICDQCYQKKFFDGSKNRLSIPSKLEVQPLSYVLWTKESEARLTELVLAGTPYKEIAQQFGRTPVAIYDKASKMHIRVPTQQIYRKRSKPQPDSSPYLYTEVVNQYQKSQGLILLQKSREASSSLKN